MFTSFIIIYITQSTRLNNNIVELSFWRTLLYNKLKIGIIRNIEK